MARILVVDTDARQASLVKAIVLNHVGAQLEVVRSKDQAVAAIDAHVPDLILLSALISPRDEEEVMAHLRTLDGADHLQTLTIPRIASSPDDDGSGSGLLRKFKRRRGAKPGATGCDPKVFAEEILGYLQRAEQIKADRAAVAEAERLAAEAQAERVGAASKADESIERPVVAEPAAETETVASAAVEAPPVAESALERPLVEALTPEIEATARAVVDTPPVSEPILELPAIEAVTPVVEATESPVVDVPLITEPAAELPAIEAVSAEAEVAAPVAVDAPEAADTVPEAPDVEVVILAVEAASPSVVDAAPVTEPTSAPPTIEEPAEIELVAAPEQEPAVASALVAESPAEALPVMDVPSADLSPAEDAVAPEPVVAAPVEPVQPTRPTPAATRLVRITFRPQPAYTPISALPWGDETPAFEDLHSLLHGLRLPTSLADLARAGGCRIHRVTIAQVPGPASLRDGEAEEDETTLEPHPAWLGGRRGTPVASPLHRTPAGSR